MVFKMGPEMAFYMVMGQAFIKRIFKGDDLANVLNHLKPLVTPQPIQVTDMIISVANK